MYHQSGTEYYSNTKVTYRRNASFLERIGQSLSGIAIGVLLIVAGCYAIFWNEGRAVQTSRSLDEGMSVVLSLGDASVLLEVNNDRLVHFSSIPVISRYLEDNDYGIKVNAIKLKRTVEMYQWHEEESTREVNEGSETRQETTYSYSTKWSSTIIDSKRFHNRQSHENPRRMDITPNSLSHNEVKTGQFLLSKGLLKKIENFQAITENMINNGELKYIRESRNQHYIDGIFYHSENPSRPMVGDYKVTFTYAGSAKLSNGKDETVTPTPLSVVSKQLDINSLAPFKTLAGDEIELLEEGELSAKEVFEKAHSANNMKTWMIRGVCWLIIFIGFNLSTNIVNVIVSWIPLLREIVSFGMLMLNITLSLSLTVSLSAIAWIRYRPVIGSVILGVLAFSLFGMSKLSKKNKKADRFHFD